MAGSIFTWHDRQRSQTPKIFRKPPCCNVFATGTRGEDNRRRSKAISDLICNRNGDLLSINSPDDVFRLADAAWLRDDYTNNSYFKILLRRRHLCTLFVLLLLAIIGSLFIWPVDNLPGLLNKRTGRVVIILSGILGGSISFAQNLLSTDISAKIPAQQIGSFLTWMRPAIGAASALIAVKLIEAGSALHVFDDQLVKNPAAILVNCVCR